MKECCNAFLMEQFGDQDVVNEIYEEYANSIREKLPEAEAALNSADWVALDHVAHAVKGNALATGDNDVANVAIALRMASNLKDRSDAQSLLDKLKELAKEI
ncbi:MAG: Hpt domain-containing protein [Victivallales bacterium]|nr:Hpt domain-containing protein [Victivallales bacterium]